MRKTISLPCGDELLRTIAACVGEVSVVAHGLCFSIPVIKSMEESTNGPSLDEAELGKKTPYRRDAGKDILRRKDDLNLPIGCLSYDFICDKFGCKIFKNHTN